MAIREGRGGKGREKGGWGGGWEGKKRKGRRRKGKEEEEEERERGQEEEWKLDIAGGFPFEGGGRVGGQALRY